MSVGKPRRPHIVVIDPGVKIAEIECFNALALMAPLACTYHVPAMQGMQSLAAEDLGSAKGLIILGSASSVNDRADWQVALEAWLKPALDKGLPTLGICYGHQMLAHMYGGKVGFLHADQAKDAGFREIQLDGAGGAPWAKGKGRVVVSHCETVTDVPASMTVFATSAAVATDGLRHKTLPIFSFQSHPEATREFLNNHEITGDDGSLAFGQGLMTRFLDYVAGI